MSVNIGLVTLDHKDHPTWDWSINGGHKFFAREVMHTLPMEHHLVNPDPYIDDTVYHRPTDFAAWRRAIVGLPNEELFGEMLDILEQDPRYWIYVSQ